MVAQEMVAIFFIQQNVQGKVYSYLSHYLSQDFFLLLLIFVHFLLVLLM